MPGTIRSGKKQGAEKADWADPGYFSGQSAVANTLRVVVQMVRPPRGHRTIPTKAGLMLILIVIGVGTAAFNTGQNILYLALAILLSTLLVSGILSWVNFKGCRWRLETGRHFRAGESSPVYLDLHNTKKYLPSYSLTFQVAALHSRILHSMSLDERLDPHRKIRLQWEFIPERRGLETVSLQGLISRYPFGFLRKSIRDSFEKEVVVWPARIAYQFSGDKAGRRWLYGRHRRRGEGVDLVQIRQYRSGDPLKHIHWKATARMGSLQVRETEVEHHQAFSLYVDPSPHQWREDKLFEKMCAFAASLAEDLYRKDHLRVAQIAGKPPRSIGAIEDLYGWLDEIGLLERKELAPESEYRGKPRDAVTFQPGSADTVFAMMEGVKIGQA